MDRRPTTANVVLLRTSRVEPTTALVAAAAQLSSPPALWLQMSTLAIYGDAGEDIVDERYPAAAGPPQMAGVARAWEQAVDGAVAERLVVLRTGIVLDRHTPAFDRLTSLTRIGLGGRIGRGGQWISWIHVDDFLKVIRFLCDAATIDGVVHVTAPYPVRNKEMMAALRAAMHRPWSPPTPAPLVRAGALLLRTRSGPGPDRAAVCSPAPSRRRVRVRPPDLRRRPRPPARPAGGPRDRSGRPVRRAFT